VTWFLCKVGIHDWKHLGIARVEGASRRGVRECRWCKRRCFRGAVTGKWVCP